MKGVHVHSLKTLVTASHVGPSGYQTTLSVLSMMQDCSLLWFEANPALKQYLDDNGIFMVMTSRQVDFLQKVAYVEPLTVETGVFECNGYTGSRVTAMYNKEGNATAVSWSMGLFINRETGRPARLPKSIVEAFPFDEKLDMEYTDKRIALPDFEPQVYPSITAMRSDIDYNQHVNNTHYVRMASEYLPEDIGFGRLRVEYKIAAVQGDKLTPQVYCGDDVITVVLNNDDEKPYALVEFSLLSKNQ